MASTISSRPSHYDALGLSPAASQDEIARAFAKAMGLFGARSAAAAARIGLAFETLRNPDKRRAYDESLGLRRELRPAPAPMAVSFRISAPAPAVAAEPHVEPSREPGPASFIASSLREIARPVEADPPPRPASQSRPAPPRQPLARRVEVDQLGEAEEAPIEWRRPAIAIGTVVLAAGLVGALAGVSVKGDEQGQAAVTTALPAAKPRGQVVPPPAAKMPVLGEDSAPHRPVLSRGVETRPLRPAAPQPGLEASGMLADSAPATQAQADEAVDPLAPQPTTSIETVAAADLPLASKLVARTIDRIGYACGEVASASAVDGSAGVYKVTCTSGQSYRAAPVHGRYHFRRWGSR